MNAKWSILVVVIVILNVGGLRAQSNTAVEVKHFGIGMHIEQFRVSDLGDMYTTPVNKILFSWNPCNSFKVEPEFGFVSSKNKADDLKNSGVFYGLGLMGMIQRNRLNIYGGARVEGAVLKWEEKIYTGGGTYAKMTTNAKRLSLSPVFGGEYFLSDNFSFGGELGVRIMAYKSAGSPNSTYNNDEDQTAMTTETGLFVRFYFGK